MVGCDDNDQNERMMDLFIKARHYKDFNAVSKLLGMFQGDDHEVIGGNPMAEALFCHLLYHGRCIERNRHQAQRFEGIPWLEHESTQGHQYAQYCLALCYDDGLGVRRDTSHALLLFEQAAEQHLSSAYLRIAQLIQHEPGYTTPKYSHDDSIKYFKLAAENGHPEAQWLLGLYSKEGIMGLPKDQEAAFYWFSMAATQRHPSACMEMAMMYENGISIEKDVSKAISLYKHALTRFVDEATEALHRLGYHPSDDEDEQDQDDDDDDDNDKDSKTGNSAAFAEPPLGAVISQEDDLTTYYVGNRRTISLKGEPVSEATIIGYLNAGIFDEWLS